MEVGQQEIWKVSTPHIWAAKNKRRFDSLFHLYIRKRTFDSKTISQIGASSMQQPLIPVNANRSGANQPGWPGGGGG